MVSRLNILTNAKNPYFQKRKKKYGKKRESICVLVDKYGYFAASGVQLAQSNRGLFHFRRAALSSDLLVKVGSTLTKVAALRVNLNMDDTPITSRTHTHPSHS